MQRNLLGTHVKPIEKLFDSQLANTISIEDFSMHRRLSLTMQHLHDYLKVHLIAPHIWKLTAEAKKGRKSIVCKFKTKQ